MKGYRFAFAPQRGMYTSIAPRCGLYTSIAPRCGLYTSIVPCCGPNCMVLHRFRLRADASDTCEASASALRAVSFYKAFCSEANIFIPQKTGLGYTCDHSLGICPVEGRTAEWMDRTVCSKLRMMKAASWNKRMNPERRPKHYNCEYFDNAY